MQFKVFLFLFLISIGTIHAQKSYTKTELGLKAEVDSFEIELQFYSSKSIRVLKSKKGFDFEKKSLSVIANPQTTLRSIKEIGDTIVQISSESLAVNLDLSSGKLVFLDKNGNVLLNEKLNGSHLYPRMDVNEKTFRIKQEFQLDNNEHIYGLGQFQEGKMSQRNQELFMRQDNLETAVPIIQSNKGYGVFWDNYAPTTFFDDASVTSFESEVGDLIDYYFMYGKNADGVVAQIRALTGQAPMMPYWTFGYWQSKERYESQEETVGVVKKYRDLGVPIDGIIQDWQYWGDNYHWNGMTFGNPTFPDPVKFTEQIHDLNAHIIISVWASFGPKTEPFKILKDKNMLLDFTTYPERAVNYWPAKPGDPISGVRVYDPYNPEARDIYWDYLNKGIFSKGVDGWWLDSTEPDHLNIKDKDFDVQTHLGSFRKVRNAFPLMTVGGVYDHQRETTSDKRVFILTRSAFVGQQRYAANSWSGDIVSSWETLEKQISAGLNFVSAGIPYWNTDIGGFFTWKYPKGIKNPSFQELYVRWVQYGAFTPMMRSHGTTTPREIYQLGNRGDWNFDAVEKFINLRYRLLPYIYSNSWQVTSNASTMMRPLFMDFSKDTKALDLNDEFMFGKSILVAPVTEALYTEGNEDSLATFEKIGSRKVYLPDSTDWIDFWTGEKLKGGQEVEKEVPIDIMPLFIKAGSIIPFGPKVQYANEKKGPIEIRIYPGKDAQFTYYDDERDNYNYEEGSYATIEFLWDDSKNKLTIGERKGNFKGLPKNIEFEILIVKGENSSGIYPKASKKCFLYKGKSKTMRIK
ncbi:TIM-barrel domain-containing protein [Thalassobellus sediminis]|uniref:glycoside hydrolase family 31 protein n=1 Tax=Thalassobellus sediminis TaxID=3367753 RepID=UPI0037B49E8B